MGKPNNPHHFRIASAAELAVVSLAGARITNLENVSTITII
jgi:hypothetical protein